MLDQAAHLADHHAKPRPCSPARAGFTATVKARILVWKAMPSITLKIAALAPVADDPHEAVVHGLLCGERLTGFVLAREIDLRVQVASVRVCAILTAWLISAVIERVMDQAAQMPGCMPGPTTTTASRCGLFPGWMRRLRPE